MSDDPDKPESGAGEARPQKIKAEHNPWYLLATLYGVPELVDDGLQKKNRVAWNRYFAANLDEETRTKLIDEKRHPAEELRTFSPDELQEIATAFAERCKASSKKPALPASNAAIDFSDVDFEQYAFFQEHLFSSDSTFTARPSPATPSFAARPSPARRGFTARPSSGRPYFAGLSSAWPNLSA